MSLIPLDTMGYKPVCCKNEHINKKHKQADTKEPDHYIPPASPASANQSCRVNTRNKHSLTCKRNFSPEEERKKKHNDLQKKYYSVSVFVILNHHRFICIIIRSKKKLPGSLMKTDYNVVVYLFYSGGFHLPPVCPHVSEWAEKLTVASHQNSATSPILMDVSRVSHTSSLNIFPTKISAGRPASRLSSTTVRSKLSSSVWKWKTSWETESREE